MIKIYKLIYNNEIVYVGKTKLKYLSTRKAQGYGNTVPFYRDCSIELIEETNDISRENYWIQRLKQEGHPLLNKNGGHGWSNILNSYVNNIKEYKREYQRLKRKKFIKNP